jgi:hypothetical protein
MKRQKHYQNLQSFNFRLNTHKRVFYKRVFRNKLKKYNQKRTIVIHINKNLEKLFKKNKMFF